MAQSCQAECLTYQSRVMDWPGSLLYLPRILSISSICPLVSGPKSIALQFSSTCAAVLKPGMGSCFRFGLLRLKTGYRL
jgi:hypothetical protein